MWSQPRTLAEKNSARCFTCWNAMEDAGSSWSRRPTDRLYRNRTDALAFEALIEKRGVEIHLVKEGRVIGKDSRSQDKFMHDIHVAVAKHYVENLKEEVKKGMREKAEQGIYPGRAPIGYRNNSLTRSIDVDPEQASLINRTFELYASGNHSLASLW